MSVSRRAVGGGYFFRALSKVRLGIRGYSWVLLGIVCGYSWVFSYASPPLYEGLTLESGVTACAGGADQTGCRQAQGRVWRVGVCCRSCGCRLPATRVRNARLAAALYVCGSWRARTTGAHVATTAGSFHF